MSVEQNKKKKLISKEGHVQQGSDDSAQSRLLVEMDLDVKMAYLKILCNYLHHETKQVSDQECAEIIDLVACNDIDSQNRFSLWQYILDKNNLEDTSILIATLLAKADVESRDTIKLTLMQDVLRLFQIREGMRAEGNFFHWKRDQFVAILQDELNITDVQIQFFLEKLKSDMDIIEKQLPDTEIEKIAKSLAPKAAGVGIPAAALFSSGLPSTIGLIVTTFGMPFLLSSLFPAIGSLFARSAFSLLLKAAVTLAVIPGAAAAIPGVGLVASIGAYKGITALVGLKDAKNKQLLLILEMRVQSSQKVLEMLLADLQEISQYDDDTSPLHACIPLLITCAVTINKRESNAMKEIEEVQNLDKNPKNKGVAKK